MVLAFMPTECPSRQLDSQENAPAHHNTFRTLESQKFGCVCICCPCYRGSVCVNHKLAQQGTISVCPEWILPSCRSSWLISRGYTCPCFVACVLGMSGMKCDFKHSKFAGFHISEKHSVQKSEQSSAPFFRRSGVLFFSFGR